MARPISSQKSVRPNKDCGSDLMRETASRHPADIELRRRGYVIHARPNRKPAVWRRGKELFVQVNPGGVLLEQKE